MNGRRMVGNVWVRMGLLLVVAMAGVAYAQTSPPAAPGQQVPAAASGIDPLTGALPPIRELFLYSPVINGLILALSVIALMLFLYFMLTINTRSMAPADFLDEADRLIARGKWEAANDLCRANRRVFIATIVGRMVENSDKEPAVLMNIIETEGRRRADLVWNRISYLADIANVSPMLGLLGTVTGMITAFFGLQRQTFSADAAVLSRGIGQAMTTTMFGLMVAIMAMIFYSLVKGRATRVLADTEAAVHSIADLMSREVQGVPEEERSEARETASAVVGAAYERRRREDAR